MGALYHLADVTKERVAADSRFALSVPELTIEAGSAVALVGPSGCGKSTLLDLLAFASAPTSAGAFRFGDHDVAGLWRGHRTEDLAGLRAADCGYVLQTGGLLSYLTVAANIALPQRLLGRRDAGRVRALAERLEIGGHLGKRPRELSVGQRQRVAIARALVNRPRVVLADEPTASVHPTLADEILAVLVAETRASGAALVLATHDPDRAGRQGIPALTCRLDQDGRTTRSTFGAAA